MWKSPLCLWSKFASVLKDDKNYFFGALLLYPHFTYRSCVPTVGFSLVYGADFGWSCKIIEEISAFSWAQVAFLRATAAIAVERLSRRNFVRLSVCLSVTRVDQSKMVQAGITKSSPSAARKTLVSGTVKLFHKFEGGHPERGRWMRGGVGRLAPSGDWFCFTGPSVKL